MSRTPRPCSACPIRSANGWCAHLATTRPPNAPSCEWGRRKMNSQYAAWYNRKKFGWKKRAGAGFSESDGASFGGNA